MTGAPSAELEFQQGSGGSGLVDAVVVGAGPAGLAVAASLEKLGVRSELIESAECPGSRWYQRYDVLHLNTTRLLSGLPGRGIPRRSGRYPSASAYAAYLKGFADSLDSSVHTGQTVEAVRPSGDGAWMVFTQERSWKARNVILATGHDSVPWIPSWPGLDEFTGEVLHSSEYRNPARFDGLDVLVVGSGNSGADIAADLATRGAGSTTLAIRTPPQIIPRTVVGVPMQFVAVLASRLPAGVGDGICRVARRVVLGDLAGRGLPIPEAGVSTQYRESGVVPVIDRGDFSGAVASGAIEVVAAVIGLDETKVRLSDGGDLSPDVVIAATGYRTGLETLVPDAGWLDPDGLPTVHGPCCPPGGQGIFFAGFRNPLPGNLLDITRQSREIARSICRDRERLRPAAR